MRIGNINFQEALVTRYVSYALSTIMSRSLPDVRDGLKPVHRRLIYSMYELRLHPQTAFKKCARIVGDVMGKFHPHGDAPIYGALVRLAQDFSVRYPLIDGQGNFGNIDGDNPAAMRYTEARLTPIALELLHHLGENAVDFRPTYDGSEEEPLVLPAFFPNVLANGAVGIAVGMATSIPPHNLDELCQALTHLLDHPNSTSKDLLQFVQGPDFPTGGIIVSDVQSIYETGKGTLKLRARWVREDLKNGLYRIIVTEIPYQVEKSQLVERIANLLMEKKLPFLEDIQDESDQELRLVLYPKNRTVLDQHLMQSLFRSTDLEVRWNVNMNVLNGHNIPQVLPLKEMLQAFLDHRFLVLERCSRHRLKQIEDRLEVLQGYLMVYLNLDEVIHIIRTDDEPKMTLMSRFQLTERQVEAILNLRLRSLQKIQEIEIQKELNELTQEQNKLNALLGSTTLQKKEIQKDCQRLIKLYGQKTDLGRRRTTFELEENLLEALPALPAVEVEDVIVVCSAKNWIRVVKTANDLKYKEGDGERFVFPTQTSHKILLFASHGRFYTLDVHKLPRTRGTGEPLRELIDLPPHAEILQGWAIDPSTGTDQMLLVVSKEGKGFRVRVSDVWAQTRSGKQILSLEENGKAIGAYLCQGDHIALIGDNRKLLVFPLEEIPILSKGKGVMLQRYKNDTLSDLQLFYKDQGFAWKRGDKTHIEKEIRRFEGKRGSVGRLAPVSFPRNNQFNLS